MAEYYVVRDKNTGLYFRGKGVNRWGKYYNQASIYRIKANAENTIKEVSWRGEQAEIVPIQIVETSADVVPKIEVEELSGKYEDLKLKYAELQKDKNELIAWVDDKKSEVAREIFEEIESISSDFPIYGNVNTVILSERDLAFIKKKYTEGEA